jgi:hypothetical protein
LQKRIWSGFASRFHRPFLLSKDLILAAVRILMQGESVSFAILFFYSLSYRGPLARLAEWMGSPADLAQNLKAHQAFETWRAFIP